MMDNAVTWIVGSVILLPVVAYLVAKMIRLGWLNADEQFRKSQQSEEPQQPDRRV